MIRFALVACLALASVGCASSGSTMGNASAQKIDNVGIAKKMYADFGKGDIPAVLSAMSDDIVWIIPGPPSLPYSGVRHGKQEWMSYLQGLGSADILSFEAREFIPSGDKVIVLGTESLKVKATGKVATEEWAQVLTFRDGKLIHFRSYDDTAGAEAAYH